MTTPQPWSPPMTSTAIRITMDETRIRCGPRATGGAGPCCNCNYLTPLIIAAGRTNAVGNVGSSALRASAQLRQLQDAVVRAAHPLTAFGRFSLGNTHISSRKVQNFSLFNSDHAVEPD